MNSNRGFFFRKTLLEDQELKGKFVLDAGCGNGRYSYWAAQYAERVIGMDLGDGVESAGKNTTDLNHVQIVQGDIFYPPFISNCFDIIYSIGVLMHTGDAKKATTSLVQKLKNSGSITVHVYGKGNFIYEFFDRKIRERTTKLTIPQLQSFTKRLYKLRRILEKLYLAEFVNLFIKVDFHPHCIFDWYAAPIATHHTYKEVEGWFNELNLHVLATNKGKIVLGPKIKTTNKLKLGIIKFIKKIIYPFENIPVTVKARKL